MKRLLEPFDVVMTYNGAKFDLDFLEYKYGLDFGFHHVDLMKVCHKKSIYGGQKKTERELGICRNSSIRGCDGEDAVRLWREYKEKGDEGALDKLLEYNDFDCRGLMLIYEELNL